MFTKQDSPGRTVPAVPGEELDDPESLVRLAVRRQQVKDEWARRDAELGGDYPTIADFYRGRHVFVTGASGFIGKVIVEKLLRACPDIGNVYMLMRPRRGQDPEARLRATLAGPAFDRLRAERPSALSKVVAVAGDCLEEGLGIGPHDRQLLADRVSVVFHSAASIRFTEPMKKAVNLNTRSTSDVVELAREMKNLAVVIHVSTAYCFTNHQPTEECVYPTDYNWRDVLEYTKLPDVDVLDCLGTKFTGFQPNSYVFTKALAEKVMEEASYDLPVVIMRPSIVTCALRDPVPGWMDNMAGFAMFWAIASKGVLRVHHVHNSDIKFDLVPVDWVANACIIASWAKGTGQPLRVCEGNAEVVNVCIGDIKPSTFIMMSSVLEQHIRDRGAAYPGALRYPNIYLTENKIFSGVMSVFYHLIFGTLIDTILVAMKKKPMLMPIYRKTEFAFQSLQYFQKKEFYFKSDNLWHLVGLLHPSERQVYHLNIQGDDSSNWLDISRDQLLGVLKYALKEPCNGQEDIDKACRHINRLWWVEVCWCVLLASLAVWLLVSWCG